MAWKQGTKKIELNTSIQIATWRQVLEKEKNQTKDKTHKELDTLKDQLDLKNTYIHHFQSEDAKLKQTSKESKDQFKYDQVKYDEVGRGYCQKAKRESLWCKEVRPRDPPKDVQEAPLTTSQVYGWREPIDNLDTGFKRSGVCKRTFHDHGHLS